MHGQCICDGQLTSFKTVFLPQSICWHRHCVISVMHGRRCEDVVGDIHYKPVYQPIKALLCWGDQARGRLRLSTEKPVVCSSSRFPLFFCCCVLEHRVRRAAKSGLKPLLNFSQVSYICLFLPKCINPSAWKEFEIHIKSLDNLLYSCSLLIKFTHTRLLNLRICSVSIKKIYTAVR